MEHKDPIQEIVQWQHDAGLSAIPFKREEVAARLIEEALELLGVQNAGHEANNLVKKYNNYLNIPITLNNTTDQEIIEIIDCLLDCGIYKVGGLTRVLENILGIKCTVQQADLIKRCMLAVNETNKQKLACKRDEHNKLQKPEDFVPPEEKLYKIVFKNEEII